MSRNYLRDEDKVHHPDLDCEDGKQHGGASL